jgi:hypothetical protein
MHGYYGDEFGCHGRHYGRGPYGYHEECYGEPTAEDRKKYLQERKRHLEFMIKDVEGRLAELEK